MTRILVTGCTGFVGRALCQKLISDGYSVVGSVRREDDVRKIISDMPTMNGLELVQIGDINKFTSWNKALVDVNVVIHLAARVHIMRDVRKNSLDLYRETNRDGTMTLASQAVAMGVKRFIYLSSVKVNGELTFPNNPFTENDLPEPIDPYGISKFEAELYLNDLAKNENMETVIIRPPLIYGPDVKANFHAMMSWLAKGIPLPLGGVNNLRSFLALDNLLDLIITCIRHPSAGNQLFLASDGEDLSTTELLQRMGLALDKPARLFPLPRSVLDLFARAVGRRDMVHRLCDSLQVDISKARILLGWQPPISVDEGLRRAANGFLHEKII